MIVEQQAAKITQVFMLPSVYGLPFARIKCLYRIK